MMENYRWECTPGEYVKGLFGDTENGKLAVIYYPINDAIPYTLTHNVDWTSSDVDGITVWLESLIEMLTKFGKLHDEIFASESRENLLSEDELKVWNTYILPYKPFEVDEEVINELYYRAEYDSLDDEENDLLERHYEWNNRESMTRLPLKRCTPMKLIESARRYERLVSLGAPSAVLKEAGRRLALELVLYCHEVNVTKPNLVRFVQAQEKHYDGALAKVIEGKKISPWMDFIFPQLCGLNTANEYGIVSFTEAREYREDLILGSRLVTICEALLELEANDPETVFGDVDAMKLKASMTMFALLSPSKSVFHKVLDKFYGGEMDHAVKKRFDE